MECGELLKSDRVAHNDWVRAVNVSPDGTRIATGSEDETVCVWSVSGERLFGPLTHVHTVVVVKFSLADASSPLSRGTMRLDNSQNVVGFPVLAAST